MCGRYLLRAPLDLVQRAFGFAERPNLAPRFNIAPTQDVAIVRLKGDGGGRELAFARWGLVPPWAKEAAVGGRMINARAEGIAEKPSFRAAFRKRRCLVLADGFYEWRKVAGGKRPVLIQRRGVEPFAFAGLWESWKGPEGPLETCAIITTSANALLAPIHDRMPVMLGPDDHGRWLDASRPGAEELLRPCPEEWLETAPASTRVNNPRNDDPSVLEAEA